MPLLLVRFLPASSPVAALAAVMGDRSLPVSLVWTLPWVFVLLLAVGWGRFFCRWVCPAGTVIDGVSSVAVRRGRLHRPLRAFVFWTIAASAVLGAPFLLLLDPLASTSRVLHLLFGEFGAAVWLFGLLPPLVVLLALISPGYFCRSLCPLGYLFDLVHYRRAGRVKQLSRERRQVLCGLVSGAGLVLGGRARIAAAAERAGPPVLAPGAGDPLRFASLCSRCYACVRVCPTGILRPRWSPAQAAWQWFEPELAPERGVCEVGCVACTEVCPTAALVPVPAAEKGRLQLGVARVLPAACLRVANGIDCKVCLHRCPYDAIRIEPELQPSAPPRVLVERCNGCGYCVYYCPATAPGKALEIDGVPTQSKIEDEHSRRG